MCALRSIKGELARCAVARRGRDAGAPQHNFAQVDGDGGPAARGATQGSADCGTGEEMRGRPEPHVVMTATSSAGRSRCDAGGWHKSDRGEPVGRVTGLRAARGYREAVSFQADAIYRVSVGRVDAWGFRSGLAGTARRRPTCRAGLRSSTPMA
jgi:hypothetical protein